MLKRMGLILALATLFLTACAAIQSSNDAANPVQSSAPMKYLIGVEKDQALLLSVELLSMDNSGWQLSASVRNISGQEVILHPTCDGLVRLEGRRQDDSVACKPQAPFPLQPAGTHQISASIGTEQLGSPTKAYVGYGYEKEGRTITALLQPSANSLKEQSDLTEACPFRPIDLSNMETVYADFSPHEELKLQVFWAGDKARRLAKALSATQAEPDYCKPTELEDPTATLTFYDAVKDQKVMVGLVMVGERLTGVEIYGEHADRGSTAELEEIMKELRANLPTSSTMK